MNQSEVFSMSRLNTGTDSSNLPDATLLTITNVTYRDLINTITSEVNADFFYQEWTGSTVVWQEEYTFPIRTSSIAGLKKLISVSIKWKTDDAYFQRLKTASYSSLDNDDGYLKVNQPKTSGFYDIRDKSVFITPAPTEVGSIKLYWVSDPTELQLWASEADIVIPVDFHHLIVLGNEYRIYKAKRMTNEKNDALAEYNQAKLDMVSSLKARNVAPIQMEDQIFVNLK